MRPRESYEERCWREALAELQAAEAEMAASMSDAAWHRWQAARATVAACRGEQEQIILPHVERQAEQAERRQQLMVRWRRRSAG